MNPSMRLRAGVLNDYLVPVQPIPDDPFGLLGLLPEKTVAAALDDFEFGAFDVIAEILRRIYMIAGIA